MDKCIVEGGKNVGYAEDEFSLSDLRAEGDDLFLLNYLLLRRLSHSQ